MVLALTGIRLPALDLGDYRPAILIGLGCLAALLLGLRLGIGIIRLPPVTSAAAEPAFGWWALIAVYLGSVAITGVVQELAWESRR